MAKPTKLPRKGSLGAQWAEYAKGLDETLAFTMHTNAVVCSDQALALGTLKERMLEQDRTISGAIGQAAAQSEQVKDLKERLIFWEGRAKTHKVAENYYREQLVNAHAQLGRVVMQLSEQWDTVQVTEHFPTDNLHGKRTVSNPSGGKRGN